MEENPDREMSLIGHLSELRTRIIVCLIALFLTFIISLIFADHVLEVLIEPVKSLPSEPGREQVLSAIVAPDGTLRLQTGQDRPDFNQLSHQRLELVWPADPAHNLPENRFFIGQQPTQKIYYHNPVDPFLMQMKVALILSIALGLPIILWQLWRFIQPGLTPKEQSVVKPLLAGALILFPIGAGFAWFLIKLILVVMMKYTVEGIDPLISIYQYLSLLTTMMLAFGLIFEFPLVVAIASRVGLVTPGMLTQYRRHAYVGLAVAAMILTPNDGFTMISAFIPLVFLYELSIGLARPMAALHSKDNENLDETIDFSV